MTTRFHPTLAQLRAVSATARARSITGAAQALSLTPPAVSTQIKGLEEAAGALLFDREAGFALTPYGAEVLALADQIEGLIHEAGGRLEALRRGAAGSFTLAAVSTAKYIAPRLVAVFLKATPGLEIRLKIGNRASVIDMLARREADLALMGRAPDAPPIHADRLGEHPHILIAAPDDPLAGRAGLTAADLTGRVFLAREEGSGTRALMSDWLKSHGVASGRMMEYDSNESIKQAVMAGLGLSFISAHACAHELTGGRLAALSLPDLPVTRFWMLARRADGRLNPAGEAFRRWMLARAARPGGFLAEE